MADVFPWSALRPDGTGQTGVCMERRDAIAALVAALHDIEPGVIGTVQAADLPDLTDTSGGYVYREVVARARRDAQTGALVWLQGGPEPESVDVQDGTASCTP